MDPTRPRKRPFEGGGDLSVKGVPEDVREKLCNLMEKAKTARNDIGKLKQKMEALDEIEDRLYSSLARLMEKYSKPEFDMLRVTSLESTIANMQQVDLPRISKLELNHAQQQQQLELLSNFHNKSLEVELPRITKLELVTAQMQQQIEGIGSSHTKALEEDSTVRSQLAFRAKELEDHVSAQRTVTKEEDLSAKLEMESRIDELKNDVSVLKKMANDTSAEGSEAALNMKELKDRVSALDEASKGRSVAISNVQTKLGEVEEKVNTLLRNSQAKVTELSCLFGSAVKDFEANVGANFTNRTKELETYLLSKLKVVLESNLDVNLIIKRKELEAYLRSKVKLLENNLKTNFTAKTNELESTLKTNVARADELASTFLSRVQAQYEDFDTKTRELQINLEFKLGKMEENLISQFEELGKSNTAIQVLQDEVEGIDNSKDYKNLDTQVQDMSYAMTEMANHFQVDMKDIKVKMEMLEVQMQSELSKAEEQAIRLSTFKNYEMIITRLSTRVSALDSMIVSLKSSWLAKEAEFLNKFSELETTNDSMATRFLELLPPHFNS